MMNQSISNTRTVLAILTISLISLASCKAPQKNDSEEAGISSSKISCDVIIAGGSTAALAAAISSADQGVKTCLLEPTDWAGGQMTASAVSAIDFAHHRPNGMDLPGASLDLKNLNKDFANILAPFRSNPGKCWVSAICYEPIEALNKTIKPLLDSKRANLQVFYNTVVKNVVKANGEIVRLQAIQRTPIKGSGWENTLSKDISEWYSLKNSTQFVKKEIILSSGSDKNPIFIDATEFGDILALSDAQYLQGSEPQDGSLASSDTCGQAIVYPLVLASEKEPSSAGSGPIEAIKDTLGNIIIKPTEKGNETPFADGIPPAQTDLPNFFSLGKFTFGQVWSYRRIKESARTQAELSLQNWYPGNDYGGGYFLKSKAATKAEITNWSGGVDKDVLRRAENHAYAWAKWYIAKAPKNNIRYKLDKAVLGTAHGLAKMPYVRDTRRSIGIDDFVLKFADLKGTSASDRTGNAFSDRVAIGAYVADIHSINSCSTPSYLNEHDTLPFFIPLRALTNKSFDNLLVAGKTMAQSYHANAATRLQPIEWNTGAAAGISAAFMVKENLQSSRDLLQKSSDIQKIIKAVQPIDWTIGGKVYPDPKSIKSN